MFDRRDDFPGVNEAFSPAELTEHGSVGGTRTRINMVMSLTSYLAALFRDILRLFRIQNIHHTEYSRL